jgi:hypothetical protein
MPCLVNCNCHLLWVEKVSHDGIAPLFLYLFLPLKKCEILRWERCWFPASGKWPKRSWNALRAMLIPIVRIRITCAHTVAAHNPHHELCIENLRSLTNLKAPLQIQRQRCKPVTVPSDRESASTLEMLIRARGARWQSNWSNSSWTWDHPLSYVFFFLRKIVYLFVIFTFVTGAALMGLRVLVKCAWEVNKTVAFAQYCIHVTCTLKLH